MTETESHRVHIFEHSPGDWWAECLVCGAWVSSSTSTRRDAEQKFGRHWQNDHSPDPEIGTLLPHCAGEHAPLRAICVGGSPAGGCLAEASCDQESNGRGSRTDGGGVLVRGEQQSQSRPGAWSQG